jgi:nicotinate-nucleotide adenylyltransferase
MALENPSLPAREARRIGILGGTFDPVHIGHLIIAEEARARLGLQQVVLVPARVSPHKLWGTAATAEDRFRMVQLAIADNPSLVVSRVDIDRAGPSFTVDTLRALQTEYGPAAQLYFVMGADSLVHLKAWREPTEILRLARLVAVTRPGYAVDLAALERDLPGLRSVTEILVTVQLEISATALRERLREGWPIRYQVPAAVEAYIREHHLYVA